MKWRLLLCIVLVYEVYPLEDHCNHWNATVASVTREATVDCITSSVVNSGELKVEDCGTFFELLFIVCVQCYRVS